MNALEGQYSCVLDMHGNILVVDAPELFDKNVFKKRITNMCQDLPPSKFIVLRI